MQIRKPIVRYLARSPLVALIAMTLCFLMFGYFSVNIFVILQANIDLINRFGLQALADGAAIQLLAIVLSAFASVIFYSAWKVCERLIVDWVTKDEE